MLNNHMYRCPQSCLTLCYPMDCSLPRSSIHEIFQARILEWVAFPPPGDPPDPGIEPVSLALAGAFFTTEPPGKPQQLHSHKKKLLSLKY